MNLTQRRERFRAVLAGNQCVYPASVFDPISARIAEDLGFEVGMLAGSIASGTVLGAPDLVVLTLTEFAQQIHRICRAGNLSLMVDADHGYGNALSVMRTVEELETAGVACLTIEDTVLPTSFGNADGAQLISLEEGVGRVGVEVAVGEDDPERGIFQRLVVVVLVVRKLAEVVDLHLRYSSSVVISPGSTPSSRALSRRRMILPERVLGRLASKAISAGTAIGPSSWRT